MPHAIFFHDGFAVSRLGGPRNTTIEIPNLAILISNRAAESGGF